MARGGRTRDTDEFDELVGAAWPRLHRTALLLTEDPELADRLARRSLEETWAAWPRVRRDDPLAFAGTVLLKRRRGLGPTDLSVLDSVDLTPGADEGAHAAPDPALLREVGRRRRDRRRIGVVASCLGAVLVLVAGVAVVSMLPSSRQGDGRLRFDEPSALSPYEKRVLREVPGAYAVDGVVVVPGAVDPRSARNALYADPKVDAALVPLGTHLFTGVGDLASTVVYPEFMHGPAPIDSQVVADVGPGSLGCQHNPGRACTLMLEVSDHRAGTSLVEVLDADGFLEPDVELQIFERDVYGGHRAGHLVIGGVGGTATTRVVLTLADGTTRAARVDRGGISPGDSVFWSVVAAPVTRVTAYDAAGEVVNRHRVRPCDDPVSCRVR